MNFFQQNLDFTFKDKAICEKYLFFSHLKKKNEMAQGRGWPNAGYLSLNKMNVH